MPTAKIDFPQIKLEIKSALDLNNTTTSSLLDLSSGLSKRVQRVVKLNPEKLPLQPSIYPCVTINTERKNIEISDIATDQVMGKRRAEIDFKIMGIVFNTNYQTDVFNDAADDDVEELMENVEAVLRSYHTLNNEVKWQFPTDVVYHSSPIGEDAHMRIGELTLRAVIFY